MFKNPLSTAGGLGSVLGWETKIRHATWCSQTNKLMKKLRVWEAHIVEGTGSCGFFRNLSRGSLEEWKGCILNASFLFSRPPGLAFFLLCTYFKSPSPSSFQWKPTLHPWVCCGRTDWKTSASCLIFLNSSKRAKSPPQSPDSLNKPNGGCWHRSDSLLMEESLTVWQPVWAASGSQVRPRTHPSH